MSALAIYVFAQEQATYLVREAAFACLAIRSEVSSVMYKAILLLHNSLCTPLDDRFSGNEPIADIAKAAL